MPKQLILVLLTLIVLTGGFFRIYQNNLIPAGFFCDEASIGYNAYKLLTTGADEYKVSWPFFFEAFGDYRLPVPIYSNIPFVALFGLSEFTIRFTTAFFGTLNIIVIFFLVRKIFKNEPEAPSSGSEHSLRSSSFPSENDWIGILSALFVAISPWHIQMSRFGSEYIFFPFWFCLALYIFFKGLENKKWLLVSGLLFGVSLYTYYPALFIVPMFATGLISIFYFKRPELRQYLIVTFITVLVCLIPFLSGLSNGSSNSRWEKVSVFNQPNAARKITSAYIAHFSPQFLFIKGDIDYPGHFITRFSVRGMGELYWFQLPLILLGFVFLIKNSKYHKAGLVLLIWLLLYPLGSSLTGTDGGGPFAFRSVFGVIPFQIISALGLYYFINLIKNPTFKFTNIFLVILIIVLSVVYFLQLYQKYPNYSSDFWGWQYGPKPVMQYFIQNHQNYDQLILMGRFNSPEIFPQFYDPTNKCSNKCIVGDLSNFDPQKKQLFAIGTELIPQTPPNFLLKNIETIYYPNGKPAFYIVEIITQDMLRGI